ncbi:MAG: hypothetical protein R3C03_13795 [Pirellulaceae bacterium]
MPNSSFTDLAPNGRRKRVAEILGIGVHRVLEQKAENSRNSPETCLDVPSDLRLSVPEASSTALPGQTLSRVFATTAAF